MNFEEFTQQALRTESLVESANINMKALVDILDLYIAAGTVLDYFKKGIFYNNYTKYDENYVELVERMNDALARFIDNKEERHNLAGLDFRLVHGLLGVVTESAEIAEHLTNYLEDGTVDPAGIGEEFSDVDWYKAVTFNRLNLSEEQCRTNVINKLKVRFPDKYSDEHAANRNLDSERQQLEMNI